MQGLEPISDWDHRFCMIHSQTIDAMGFNFNVIWIIPPRSSTDSNVCIHFLLNYNEITCFLIDGCYFSIELHHSLQIVDWLITLLNKPYDADPWFQGSKRRFWTFVSFRNYVLRRFPESNNCIANYVLRLDPKPNN